MSTLRHEIKALAVEVSFTGDMMRVVLADGREIGVPLSWFPRLRDADAKQRSNYRLLGGGVGIHFPDVDEDILVPELVC